MAEGPEPQVEATVYRCASYGGEVGLMEESGARQVSEYCRELLTRGCEELSLEELRAERYFLQRQQHMEEKMKRLMEVKQQLSHELEQKTRLLQLRTSQQCPVQVLHEDSPSSDCVIPPATASFQIYDDSQYEPVTTARPARKFELLDDVFLRPDETGLCLKIQCPSAGTVCSSGPSQMDKGQIRATASEGMDEDLQTLVDSSSPSAMVSNTAKNLSPIQEMSVEANSLASPGGPSSGNCSPLEEKQEEMEDTPSAGPDCIQTAVDPCDLNIRKPLLDLCDVTSSPGFYSESRPLPAVCNVLQLGGDVYHIYSTVVETGSFSIYKGATDDSCVVLKVDSCCVPWDFYQFSRLRKSLAATAASLPLISCFLFLDGCITVYTSPPDRMFTELSLCDDAVRRKAILLLQLVLQLHSCRILHAALQPSILTLSLRGFMNPDWVFPVDWSSSVDLDLQQDIRSVQQLPSAQLYISQGLLEPTAPPHMVDLVGVAETVHFLLTDSTMVPVKDDAGWTAEKFSGGETCISAKWTKFFRSLLNADGRSSLSILSELKEHLSTL